VLPCFTNPGPSAENSGNPGFFVIAALLCEPFRQSSILERNP
jgi:hypothetical protein